MENKPKKWPNRYDKRVATTPEARSIRMNAQKKELIEAMHANLGIVTATCKQVGCHPNTFYKYYNQDPEFAKACDFSKNTTIDFAESHLFKQIKKGINSSTIFYLKTQGKSRGYVEKQEIEHSGSINFIIQPINYSNTLPTD